MRKLVALALAVLALVVFTTPVYAQVNNASITATATVQAPINVTAVSNLDFQSVFPGVAKTVLATAATAGRWALPSSPICARRTTTCPASSSSGWKARRRCTTSTSSGR